MRRCLELAAKGSGSVAPNPMVGAVLVFGHSVIGEGFHELYGRAHAEINCLNSVSAGDRHLIPQSTMYVSLEPCAHHGKTPPCAVRLAAEKPRMVVVCNEDLFEQVNGRGMQLMKEAGIETVSGVLADEGRWLNRRFFTFHTSKRPYIILKWAQTQEGYLAPADRSRFQISNPHSRQLAHRWRAEEAAIMVGTQTALSDDPGLTTRHWKGRHPLRIVLDRSLRLPESLRLFNGESPTWIVNEQREDTAGTMRYVKLAFNEELLPALMEKLHQAGILSVLVEGGAALLDSFIRRELWDEARIFRSTVSLPAGIAAPFPDQGVLAVESQIAADVLQVYTHHQNPYPYQPGMGL